MSLNWSTENVKYFKDNPDELPALLVLHHCNHAPIVPIPEPRIKLSERPAFANRQPGAPRRIGTAVLAIVDVLGKV
jgi:hypothetical protein